MLDIREIQEILPHRYPFLLVDRILELEEGRRAVGIKNVSANEPYFQGIDNARFRRQVVPGDRLIIEVEVIKLRGKIGKAKARAVVEDQLAAEAEFMFAIGQ